MEVVVESGCQVLTDHTLPFPFSGSEVSLVLLEVLDQLEANVLLKELLRLFQGFLDKLGGFLMAQGLLLTTSLTSCIFMSLCLSLKGGRSASGSFTYSSSSSSYMLVIFILNQNCVEAHTHTETPDSR